MTQEIQLKNGLPVLIIESHKSPVVSIQMWVKTGSADEQEGLEGISHFIEHLVFKGTKKFGVGDIANAVESAGGQLNAYTSFDETVFYVTISKDFIEAGLEVICEMMGFPRFETHEIDSEREVVLEEIKRTLDDPHRHASQSLFASLYKDHPYGQPIIGQEQVITNIQREKLVQYFQSRYVPHNMTLLVVGDFNSEHMKGQVEKYFGELKPHKLKRVQRKVEPSQKESRIEVLDSRFKETTLHLAWRIPSVRHKDIPPLEVLSMVLAQGDSSRLTQSLRIQRPLVNYVHSGLFVAMDPGFFSISVSLKKEKINETLDILLEELKGLLAHPPTESEIAKAIVGLQSEEFFSMETVDGLARKAGFYQQMFGDHQYHAKYLRQVQEITYFDLLRVFKEYIRPETLNFVLVGPNKDSHSHNNNHNHEDIADNHEGLAYKEISQQWIKKFRQNYQQSLSLNPSLNSKISSTSSSESASKASSKINSEEIKIQWPRPKSKQQKQGQANSFPKALSNVERITLTSGARLILKPSDETPVINMKCAFLGGLRAEKETETGITNLLSRVWSAGTESTDETTMYAKMDHMASNIHAFGGRNTVGLSMTTLSPFWDPMYNLFREVLTEPLFSGKAVEREKSMMLEVVKTRSDHPAQECFRNLHDHLFKGHPYAKDFCGSESTVKALDTEKLRSFFYRSTNVKDLCIAVVGDIVDRDAVINSLNQVTELWKEKSTQQMENSKENLSGKNPSEANPSGISYSEKFSYQYPTKPLKLFMESTKEQSHLALIYPGLTFQDPRRYTLEVIQALLSGQGGRLFIELRDKASLAYTVSPLRLDGIDAGYFGGYIGCSPEKVETAVLMMKKEFAKLAENKVSQNELDRSRKYLIGKHDIELQRNSSTASAMIFNEIYGLPYDEAFYFRDKLASVSAKDIQQLASEIFSFTPCLSLVGSHCPWQ